MADPSPPRPLAIELRHLRYFLAVMDELHFRRAADRVHISQPPLSQAIRKLEDELEVKLLHRTSRTVTPTAAGTVFAEEARRVLAAFDVAVSEARRAGSAAPPLRIGCTPALSLERLQSFLQTLQQAIPGVAVDLTHAPRPRQVTSLHRGELDVGIFHHDNGDESVETEPLFAADPLAVILAGSHPLAARDVLRPADLETETLITTPRSFSPSLYDHMLSELAGAGYRFAAVRETSGANERDVIAPVVSGWGITIRPSGTYNPTGNEDMVVRRPLDPPVLMPEIVLAWRSPAPSQLRDDLELVRRVAAEVRRSGAAEAPGD